MFWNALSGASTLFVNFVFYRIHNVCNYRTHEAIEQSIADTKMRIRGLSNLLEVISSSLKHFLEFVNYSLKLVLIYFLSLFLSLYYCIILEKEIFLERERD